MVSLSGISRFYKLIIVTLCLLGMFIGAAVMTSSSSAVGEITTNYLRVNNQTILEYTCRNTDCKSRYFVQDFTWDRQGDGRNSGFLGDWDGALKIGETLGVSGDLGLSDGKAPPEGYSGSRNVFVANTANSASICLDIIYLSANASVTRYADGSSDNKQWEHLQIPKTNGLCHTYNKDAHSTPISVGRDISASRLFLYQNPSNGYIYSTDPSRSTAWIKINDTTWIQDAASSGDQCPHILKKSNQSNLFFVPVVTENGPVSDANSGDALYRDYVKKVGQDYNISNLNRCRVNRDSSSNGEWIRTARTLLNTLALSTSEDFAKNFTYGLEANLSVNGNSWGALKFTSFDDYVGKTAAGEYAELVRVGQLGPPSPNKPDTPEQSIPTCNISGGLGWILCPVSNFMATMVDAMWGFISDQLSVDSSLYEDSKGGTYDAWKVFRDFANIAFIIVFLIIIYSQITSVGISNYGIKKMLPKIIIAAILVNVSYFICQLAVDLSNMLGYSIKGVFNSIDSSLRYDIYTARPDLVNSGGGVVGVITGILIGGAILLVALALGLLVPVLLAVLLVVGILLLRQVFVVLLIVISPLAFVAYLLPNTEKWFKKWWDTFIKILMVFPIIALVVGGSSLASTIISNSTTNTEHLKDDISKVEGSESGTTLMAGLMSIAIGALPLFVIPGLLRKSLDATGAVGAKIGSLGKGQTGAKFRGGVKDKFNNSNYMRNRQLKKQGRFSEKTAAQARRRQRRLDALNDPSSNRRTKLRASLGLAASGGGLSQALPAGLRSDRAQAGLDRIDQATASAVDKDFLEQVAGEKLGYSSQTAKQALDSIFDESGALKAGVSPAKRSAAIEHVMSNGSFDNRRKLVEAAGSMSSPQERKRISDGVFSKGDNNIYGNKVGDAIMDPDSKLDSNKLKDLTLENMASGSLAPQHIVQGVGSSSYLTEVGSSVPANSIAHENLVKAVNAARTSEDTKSSAETPAIAANLDKISPPSDPLPEFSVQINNS